MATRERLAQTINMKKHKFSINGHKRTPGSIEQYGIPIYAINKFSINGHKRTPGSNEQSEIYKHSINGHKRTLGSNEHYGIHKYSIKWRQENAWLKRAIWNT